VQFLANSGLCARNLHGFAAISRAGRAVLGGVLHLEGRPRERQRPGYLHINNAWAKSRIALRKTLAAIMVLQSECPRPKDALPAACCPARKDPPATCRFDVMTKEPAS